MTAIVTRTELVRALRQLGLGGDDTVLVNASVSALGYVVGGVQTVLDSLLEAVGTLVMPGFTPQLVHPAAWPESRRTGRDLASLAGQVPAFSASLTPVAPSMGRVAELLRVRPGTRRSEHPHVSFLAHGPRAAEVVATHALRYRFSERSPLGTLRHLDAKVLMLGTPTHKCTGLHLAEYLMDYPGRRRGSWAVPVPGDDVTTWAYIDELMVWEGDFDRLGVDLLTSGDPVRTALIGDASCATFPLAWAVERACGWLPRNRDLSGYADPPGWIDVTPAIGPLA